MEKRQKRVPAWMLAIIIIVALPVLAFPAMLSQATGIEGGTRYFLWLYPAYVVAASLLAWQCYGRRSEMSWIIIVLIILTHIAMWLLVGGDFESVHFL